MCQYIKDSDEQCSMDAEPFCHHHEDSQQAEVFEQAVSDAQNALTGIEMDMVCSQCDSALRRSERLTKHPNQTHRLVFEAYVECDCSEFVLSTKSVRTFRLPSGWEN
jgi:hypothetical protein